jgi:Tfp pilus assembly PilM family ATPase
MRFPLLFSKFGPIGLDVGGRSIKAVQCQKSGRKPMPILCARFSRINIGKPIDASELSTVAGVLRRQGFVGRDVVIAASAEKLKSAPLELPAKGPNVPIDRLARAEFSRLHKSDLDGSEFAYWETPTAVRVGRATSLMSIAYPHADAEQQIELYESAGLHVHAIDTHGSSLARACAAFIEPQKVSAILEIGWMGAVLVLIRNGVVAYERRIADLALSKIHEDLEEECELSFEEALAALFGAGTDRAATVTELLGDYFHLFGQELTKTFSYARHQYPESPVQRVILAGGGGELPDAAKQIETLCGVETVRVDWSGATQAIGLPAMTSAFGLSQFAA